MTVRTIYSFNSIPGNTQSPTLSIEEEDGIIEIEIDVDGNTLLKKMDIEELDEFINVLRLIKKEMTTPCGHSMVERMMSKT